MGSNGPPSAGDVGRAMRKLIMSILISLDGYASGPGGDVLALRFDSSFSASPSSSCTPPTSWCPVPRRTVGS
jgi:hypothetical protein